jgi:hypothetical protein
MFVLRDHQIGAARIAARFQNKASIFNFKKSTQHREDFYLLILSKEVLPSE